MNRIGTTTGGGAIVEISRAELITLQQAGDLLSEVAACVLIDQPAPVIARKPAKIARKPAKIARKAAVVAVDSVPGQITCSTCFVSKPASDYYGRDKQCKRCKLDRQKARKLAAAGVAESRAKRKAHGLAVIEKVAAKIKAGGTFTARERDPALDRPLDGSGRVARVGGGE